MSERGHTSRRVFLAGSAGAADWYTGTERVEVGLQVAQPAVVVEDVLEVADEVSAPS